MTIITLLTDFGTADSYVAELKGVLLRRVPEAVLVDVTHDVPPGDIRSAAYILGRSWHRFPTSTTHLAVVDPGVGTSRAALAVRAHDHYFVAPDNGVLTAVLRDTEVEAIMLPTSATAAPTFHGRDVFAPAAAQLALGASLTELGLRFDGIPERLAYTSPHQEGRWMVGEILYVDRFGTLITNLASERVPAQAIFEIDDVQVGPLVRTYSDVAAGGLLAYVGSDGTVEIAVRGGSAAHRLGVGVGGRVRVSLK
jgi:S-adenosyl-L-methionine hydrolase (adenosine-forming)